MKGHFPLQVSVNLRLRPTRIAFLVRPEDTAGLMSVFRLNTGIWGGIYNFIIPVFKSLPQRLKGRFGSKSSAREVRQAYLESIEPDYLVGIDSDSCSLFDYPRERKKSLAEITGTSSENALRLAQGVAPVYRSLYDEWFRHSLREPLTTFLPKEVSAANALFMAACFGSFSQTARSRTLQKEYDRIFAPSATVVSTSNLLECIYGNHPLTLGAAHLKCLSRGIQGNEQSKGLQLMALNSASWMDLVDFWNLRAFGLDPFPVPLNWSPDISSYCPKEAPDRALGANIEIFPSRTVDRKEFAAFLASFPRSMAESGMHLHSSLPQIWISRDDPYSSIKRGEVVSETATRQVTSYGGEVKFELLSPLLPELPMNPDCWVNEVSLSFHARSIELSQFLPRGIQSLGNSLLAVGGAMECWSDRCGVITAVRLYSQSAYWSIPTPEQIFQSWFRERGYNIEISSAGRLAREMIRSMGGRGSAYPLNSKSITSFLCELSRPRAGESARTVHQNALMAIIKKSMGGVPKQADSGQRSRKAEEAQGALNALVNKKVLKVGLQLVCPTCARRNWYSTEKIANELECDHCLQSFPFPASNPPKDAWHYRPVGPFSVPGAADGSYAVMLALHFLSHFHVTSDAAVLPGFELWPSADSSDKSEVDFAGFFRSHGSRGESSEVIFGECKSWNALSSADVRKMRRVSRAFPGSVIAFCTLKDRLASPEIKMLSRFAMAGRQPSQHRRWSTPLIILTSRELFSKDGPPRCWVGAESSKDFDRQNVMEGIANVTQQLHLGLPAYSRLVKLPKSSTLASRMQV